MLLTIDDRDTLRMYWYEGTKIRGCFMFADSDEWIDSKADFSFFGSLEDIAARFSYLIEVLYLGEN